MSGLVELLLFDREAILAGEVWRLLSGHFVHFGWRHAICNGAAVVMACWLTPAAMRRTLPGALAVIGLVVGGGLLLLAPTMARYGGFSGVVCGWLFLMGLHLRRLDGRQRTVGLLLLAGVPLKVAMEWLLGGTLVHYPNADFVPMHLAHALGVVGALGVYCATVLSRPDNKLGGRAKQPLPAS